jgi:hypothetical protein
VNRMNIGPTLRYATLCSLLMGGLGLAVATSHHREQMKTQILLALSARCDELLRSSSVDVWLSLPCDTTLPERGRDLAVGQASAAESSVHP